MTQHPTPTKYVFTLIKERNYDSDLGARDEMGSVLLAVETERIGDIERQVLELIRAAGVLDDDAADIDYDDEDSAGAYYSVEATPVIEVASVEAAAADLIQRNRWLSELRQGV